MKSIGLYVHIPFCKTKCPYCDFNTYEGIEMLMTPYVDALCKEITLWGNVIGHTKVETVFFGGGTPSFIGSDQIQHIMDTVTGSFQLNNATEITLEINPDDATSQKLEAFIESGINRLSFGVQSLDDGILKGIGRRHSAKDAVDAYNMAKVAGFKNINLDLMYGLPNQTMVEWVETLNCAIGLQSEHISAYCLTLEGGTPMEKQVQQGHLPTPDPDLAAEMYLETINLLKNHGYIHYEISNWAQKDKYSSHNLKYWGNEMYLGVGPKAHSYLDQYRFYQVKSPKAYINKVHEWEETVCAPGQNIDSTILSGVPVIESFEYIDKKLEMSETIFLGLRLLKGLDLVKFQERFGFDLISAFMPEVKELSELGLVEQINGNLKLTTKGLMLSNQVFVKFM